MSLFLIMKLIARPVWEDPGVASFFMSGQKASRADLLLGPPFMPPRYSRTTADIDLDEEAELRRLESGADPTPDLPCVDLTEPTQAVSRPSASAAQHDEGLLFACAASHQRAVKQPASRGQLRLTQQRLEFEPHGAPRLVIALGAVSAFKQSKASVGNVMAKIVLASGESHNAHLHL